MVWLIGKKHLNLPLLLYNSPNDVISWVLLNRLLALNSYLSSWISFNNSRKIWGESESSPSEEIFEDEQELLKKVYETKSGLMEGKWVVQNKHSVSQPSFLKTEEIDGEISLEFEK